MPELLCWNKAKSLVASPGLTDMSQERGDSVIIQVKSLRYSDSLASAVLGKQVKQGKEEVFRIEANATSTLE